MVTPDGSGLRYQDIEETKANLDWADLVNIDLDQFDLPGGKHKLAAQLKQAISTVGFFYVTNFGLSETEVDAQFAIAERIFALPQEEKDKYRAAPEERGHFGYKPRGSRKQAHGLADNLEVYDDPKWSEPYKDRARPQPIIDEREKVEHFQKHLHGTVLRKLLILSAIIMELEDEEALWKLHNYENRSMDKLRYMLYHPRSPEELRIMQEHNVDNVYGHTDFGSLTFLMRQPVAALQVRTGNDTEWKWVKPMKGSITVNVADTLSFLTGGYLESSIHRVVLPPEDQRHLPRYGVIYFVGPDNDIQLKAVDSPLLKREEAKGNTGHARKLMPPDSVTAGEWVRNRYNGVDTNFVDNRDNKVVVKNVEVETYAG